MKPAAFILGIDEMIKEDTKEKQFKSSYQPPPIVLKGKERKQEKVMQKNYYSY